MNMKRMSTETKSKIMKSLPLLLLTILFSIEYYYQVFENDAPMAFDICMTLIIAALYFGLGICVRNIVESYKKDK